jgi:fructose-1,6-bisphosphatase II / sedoheptulose-1,7-bisphosphatase
MSQNHDKLDRIFTMEFARVTEQTAIAAARFCGRGDEEAADKAATLAMYNGLSALAMNGTIVIGEYEDAPMLAVGSKIGAGEGPEFDIAVDPLEGATLCVKDLPNALVSMAVAQKGGLLHAPGMYMEKIAIGGEYDARIINIEATPGENIEALAKARDVAPEDLTVCILDRSRHARLIEDVRKTGAAIRLIGDGDIAGVIATASWEQTGIDIYMGVGGAPEGVLAAAALRCIGGQMQGRLVIRNQGDAALARSVGIEDTARIYNLEDLARGDLFFAASGITDGSMFEGVRFDNHWIETDTIVMRSHTGTVRRINTRHVNTKGQ